MRFKNWFPCTITQRKYKIGFRTLEGIEIHEIRLKDYPELKTRMGDDGFIIYSGHAFEFSDDPFKSGTVILGRCFGEVA